VHFLCFLAKKNGLITLIILLLLLQPLLVENIEEELDPVLDPVLERRLVKKGKSWVLQLADKEVRCCCSIWMHCTAS
jgi:hypothetical protein